jgi:hypothetical protein
MTKKVLDLATQDRIEKEAISSLRRKQAALKKLQKNSTSRVK